jgi:hypothetical protein
MTRRAKARWPDWWTWELLLSDHLERRMEDRGFSEVDLRAMIAHARSLRPSPVEGRFVVECRWKRATWRVVVEPVATNRKLIVVTAWAEEAT